VVTSSLSAVCYGLGGRSKPFTEADWSSPKDARQLPYERSKMIAERAAWDWHAREGGGFGTGGNLPGAVIGPVLGVTIRPRSTSSNPFWKAQLPGLPRLAGRWWT